MLLLILLIASVSSQEGVPGRVAQPPSVEDDQTTSTTATVTWLPPSGEDGDDVITGYNLSLVAVRYRTADTHGERDVDGNLVECLLSLGVTRESFVSLEADATNYTLMGLLPYVEYEFKIQASTIFGFGDFSPAQKFVTDNDIPGVIRELTTISLSTNSMLVQWKPPSCPNGPVAGYHTYFHPGSIPQSDSSINSSGYEHLQSVSPHVVIDDLEPTSMYLVHVRAVYIKNGTIFLGEADTESVHKLSIAIDPRDRATESPESVTSSSAVVQLPSVDSFEFEDFTYYGIVVVKDPVHDDSSTDDFDVLYPNLQPYDERGDLNYYIAAAWNNGSDIPDKFTVGNGSTTMATRNGTSESYTNAPLERATSYCVYVQVENILGNDSSVSEELVCFDTTRGYSLIGLIVGLSVSLLLLLLLLVCCNCLCYFCCCQRRNDSTKYHLYYPEKADDLLKKDEPISITVRLSQFYPAEGTKAVDFPEYVRRMHSNQDYMFTEEFANIEPSHEPSARASAANKIKNRYSNIVAYDHSRVRLEELDDSPGSDYINANYIDGYQHPEAFIASQGPMVDTVEDFWRMIWEKNTTVVVMLTKLEEKNRIRCQRYWPNEGELMEYGVIKVHLQSQVKNEFYIVRTFNIQRGGVSGEKIVKQFHYTAWPEFGVPKDMEAIILFVKLLMKEHQPDVGPMLVHCSAGVGRTGTLIAIYTQVQRLRAEQTTDVHGFVQQMRMSRNLMVQTEAEYIFIHDALVFALEKGMIEGVIVVGSLEKEQSHQSESQEPIHENESEM